MKKKYRSVLLTLALFLILLSPPFYSVQGPIPVTGGRVAEFEQTNSLPGLEIFARQLRNGEADQVRGLYAVDLFAFPVVQQPFGQPAFVSQEEGVLTQFGMAGDYGSLGFLAHNTLAGAKFTGIQPDQWIAVIFGDGHIRLYRVVQIRQFQADQPDSPFSSFIDLSTNTTLTSAELFWQTYGVKNALILQTCITRDDKDTWGRLFIIAVPLEPAPGDLR